VFEIRDKQFLIDCGEGTQIRMRQIGLKTNRMGHVFISHLHGDHVFGLIGIISSFGMLNRTADLHIHSLPELENLLKPQLNFFCEDLPFKVIFHPFNPKQSEVIYEDRSVQIKTIPLKHRVPCCGFLFEEKQGDRHIIREMIDFHEIPVSFIHKIKQGADYMKPDGEVISNEILTKPANVPIRFAYCSDTAYSEKIIPLIEGVDLLFHEATFLEEDIARAKTTMHSTAHQAAQIAAKAQVKKLILGHYSARYSNKKLFLNEAKEIFENTFCAEDLAEFEL
jgi:ribonuclease Z